MDAPFSLTLTKVRPPVVRTQQLSRKRLYSKLKDALSVRVILVSAPPGYGKTTMLAGWLVYEDQLSVTAWYTIDSGDNDPVRFWSYIITALREALSMGNDGIVIGNEFLELLHSPQAPPVESALTILINDIEQSSKKILLVLDDYHFITNQAIHQQVCMLIDRMPSMMRLVISTRTDPPIPLALYRVRGWLFELRVQDLRFTREETEILVKQKIYDVNDEVVEAIAGLTEGWVAGLQIALLSFSEKVSLSEFLRSFSGKDRFILDYLKEEVLDSQPAEIKKFLLQTSVLDRFNAALCSELTDIPPKNAQSILEYLDRANLFTEALDRNRDWYRYHPLFADILRTNFQNNQPEKAVRLRQKASVWLEKHGLIEDALKQSYALNDFERLHHLVVKNMVHWIERAETQILAFWLERFPQEYLAKSSMLCLGFGYIALYKMQFSDAERWAMRAENALDFRGSSQSQTLSNLLRSTVAINQKKFGLSIDLACRALPKLNDESPLLKGLLYLNLGDAFSVLRDYFAANEAYLQAFQAAVAAENHMLEVVIIGSIGNLFIGQGELHMAERKLQQAIVIQEMYRKQTGSDLLATGKPLTYLALINLEWFDLDKALMYAERAVHLCQRWHHTEHLIEALICLTNVLFARADNQGVKYCIDSLYRLLSEEESNVNFRPDSAHAQLILWKQQVALCEAVIELARDNIEFVQNIFGKLGFSTIEQPSTLDFRLGSALISFWLKTGKPDLAFHLAEELRKIARQQQNKLRQIDMTLLLCLSYTAVGRQTQVIPLLQEALQTASAERYVYTFLKYGKSMHDLLVHYCKSGTLIGHDYAVQLIRLFESRSILNAGSIISKLPDGNCAEQLSDREVEILSLLASDFTYQEIASKLYLSINTIKSHIKNLYFKLGVNTRLGAIEEAKKIGVLRQ